MNDQTNFHRLAAIMFTDIVAYSELMCCNEFSNQFARWKGKKSSLQVIKELGIDPKTKSAIEIKDGRYGAYVTDGKVNATLPKTTPADDITLEIAIQLIADKKAKGPVRKKYFKRKS